MAQFDVYLNPGTRTGKQAPYLVEVQGRFVDSLATCVVIPLVRKEYFIGASVLNPVIMVNNVEYFLSPAELMYVLRSILGKPAASVQAYRLEIIAAIDRLLL
ncbi:plasmid maintenance protein CcdB [Oryzomonas sagensis]|uniref:Toxin CcdB n=1 Tax=Oryzomonas sagensis TaxID=2603857 RepID=A0ABQ6TTS0_9BACT|nr:CcdB family protein [Oryzomonas sagensis]KAB0672442.1 plasmid maintenance protein CcdB [Oryzomonas sagensis]